jgi:tetratricopeptide (TPR) repeat protein
MGEKEGATQRPSNEADHACSSSRAGMDASLRPPGPPPLPQQARGQQPPAMSRQELTGEPKPSNSSNQLPLPGIAAALSSSYASPWTVMSSETQRQPLPSLPGSAPHQMLPPPSSFTPSSPGTFSRTEARDFQRPLAPLLGTGGHYGPESAGGSHSFPHAHNTTYHSSFATPPAYSSNHNTTGISQGNSPPGLHGTSHHGMAPQQAQYGNLGPVVTEAAQYNDYDQQDDQQDDEEDEDIDMIDDTGDDPLLARQNDLSTFESSVRTFVGANEKNLISEFGDKPVRQRKSVKRGPRKPAEPTGDVKLRLSAATNAFMSGDLDEALRQVNDAIRINGEIHRSWSLLAEILRERRDYKQSLLALVCAAHLQPKIFDVWLDCGRFALELSEEAPEDADDTLRIAIMSLSQAVKIQPDNVGVRQLRAALYLTRESFKLAASEYKWIVERSPHDVDALRGLADASVQLAESSRRQAEGQREAARDAYQACIKHFQSEFPTGLANTQLPFTWDDAFAYVALLIHLEQFEDALHAARSLARWLLGRREDDYWDKLPDDREWDIGDERRLDAPEFDLEKYAPEFYGRGLPLRLRISLAICRLRLDRKNDEEAMVCTSRSLCNTPTELTNSSNILNSLILQT